jgi:hypothetical protein
MNDIINYKQVEEKVISIRNQSVMLDSDVAELYGVETKRVNEAVKNNPDKFPDGYIIELNNQELENLRSKISTTNLAMTSFEINFALMKFKHTVKQKQKEEKQ